MPETRKHIDQAQRNEEATRFLVSKSTYPDWGAVTLFYAALHWVDAYLATMSVDPPSHTVREGAITRLRQLDPIYKHYSLLQDRSEDVRYRCIRLPQRFVEELQTREYEPLRQYLGALVGTR